MPSLLSDVSFPLVVEIGTTVATLLLVPPPPYASPQPPPVVSTHPWSAYNLLSALLSAGGHSKEI